MTRITFSQVLAGALVSLCLATAPARALNDHTYVSGKGADTGICTTPATACRTFAYAITQTAASGQIIAIDAANYGPVSITKSISIVADGGGPAGIFITTGTAITINAGPTDIVNLRGLTLDGAGTAGFGIKQPSGTPSGGFVTITDCFVRHFADVGIAIGGNNVRFLISNTVASDNTADAGLEIGGLGDIGVVDHVTASGNDQGIFIGDTPPSGIFVTIVDSVLTNNFNAGLRVGFAGVTSATVRLAGSVVTGNPLGVDIGPGSTVFSYGDNEINGNSSSDVSGGTLTPLAKR